MCRIRGVLLAVLAVIAQPTHGQSVSGEVRVYLGQFVDASRAIASVVAEVMAYSLVPESKALDIRQQLLAYQQSLLSLSTLVSTYRKARNPAIMSKLQNRISLTQEEDNYLIALTIFDTGKSAANIVADYIDLYLQYDPNTLVYQSGAIAAAEKAADLMMTIAEYADTIRKM